MTTDIHVRAADGSDAPAIAAIYAPFVTDSIASFEEVPPDAAEMLRRMTAPPRMPWLVAEDSGLLLGYAYASRHRARAAYRWSAEVSVYVAGTAQRSGTGRRLYERLFAELADLGYVSAFAGITLPNAASVAFHERLGFGHIGVFSDIGYKFGAWRDTSWWQRRLVDPPQTPSEPRAWSPDVDSGST